MPVFCPTEQANSENAYPIRSGSHGRASRGDAFAQRRRGYGKRTFAKPIAFADLTSR